MSTTTAPSGTERHVAHAITLLPLPSSIWRILLALGLPLGYTERGYDHLVGDHPLVLVPLSIVVEAAALAALVLVPRRRPILPARVVVGAAAVGTVVLVVLWTPFLGWWAIPHPGMTDPGVLWVGLLYLPLVAWAPLLGWLTLRFLRRTEDRPQLNAVR